MDGYPPKKLSKKKRKRLRKEVGYEEQVPRCVTCIHYISSLKGKSAVQFSGYFPPRCREHQFGVNQNGVCNDWESRSGETIE